MYKFSINTTYNYSPNFDVKKRKLNQIKFIIFHYTGMKKEMDAMKKLTNYKSKVSCHYFIKKNGDIIKLIPDLYIAWHAGVSSWKNYKFLNKNSIGIEISNPGHNFHYKKFGKKQITSIINLSKFLKKKYKIKSEYFLGHSDISPDRKKDPGENFPWEYLSKKKIGVWHNLEMKTLIKTRNKKIDNLGIKNFFKNLFKIGYSNNLSEKNIKCLIKSFQRRFRPELINGKIDKECLIISKKLLKKFK